MNLSSPSVAEYHLKKLVQGGLVREGSGGYVVDRVVWKNMIRMRRTLIPFQAVYSLFFVAALVSMVWIFGGQPARGYYFSLTIIGVALMFSLYETSRALRQTV